MRLGVLDIGSNSAQLHVVDSAAGVSPVPVHTVKEPTRLGEAIDVHGAVGEDGVRRITGAVGAALAAAHRHRVDELIMFATSAIRDAANRDQIIDRVERDTGARPDYLTGEDEAVLTYRAARHWYGWSAGRLLMLDIGGGSLEIAVGRDAEPDVALSLPLGAGRLTRAFLPDDPPSKGQLNRLRRHVRGTLRQVAERLRRQDDVSFAVATSKTFTQLARLTGAPSQRKGPFARRTVRADELARWIPRLTTMTAAQRATLRGVSRPRSRQILAGAVVGKTAMDVLDVGMLDVCPWALREGITLHRLSARCEDARDLGVEPIELRRESADRPNLRRLPERRYA